MEEPTSYSMTELMQQTPEFLWGPLLRLNYPDLMRFCVVSKDAKKICDTDSFWELKTRRDFRVEGERTKGKDWKSEYKFRFDEVSKLLLHASEWRDIARVKELLDFGVNPNTKHHWHGTALMVAAAQGRISVIRELLRSGANINLQHGGETALMEASRWGQVESVRELLMSGADPNIESELRDTALDMARVRRRSSRRSAPIWGKSHEIVGLLEEVTTPSNEWDKI